VLDNFISRSIAPHSVLSVSVCEKGMRKGAEIAFKNYLKSLASQEVKKFMQEN
jgi:hypothetical protein